MSPIHDEVNFSDGGILRKKFKISPQKANLSDGLGDIGGQRWRCGFKTSVSLHEVYREPYSIDRAESTATKRLRR